MSDPAAQADSAGQGRAYLRLVAYGALIGVPAALVAALFLAFVSLLQGWLWTDLPDAMGETSPPWYLVIGLPIVGAFVVWLARRFMPGDGGHNPLGGLSAKPVPWQYGPSVALAATGTLVFGAVLGPEAPLIALGSVVGMIVVDKAKVPEPGRTVLATAGSFSAVSALFGGPLVAGILLLEAGLAAGAALTTALIPGLVAAAVGYLLFTGLGSWGGLDAVALTVPNLPTYEGTPIGDLLLAIVVGVVVAIVVSLVRRLAAGIALGSRGRWVLVLFGGAAAVGVLAQLATLLDVNSQDVLFSGQASVPAVIATTSVGTVLVLLAAKAIGYAICLGNGFRGGPVFPGIFIGVATAQIAVVLFDASPTWAVAVGSAAGMTAGVRLVFASLVLSTLLVGSAGFDAITSAVLATVASYLTVTIINQRFPEHDVTATAGPDPVPGTA